MKLISLNSKTLCCAGWIIMFIFPTVFCCDRCLHKSKAAYHTSSQPENVGACGYESSAATLNGGVVAVATAKIYRQGLGCGACYQIRCTNQTICSQSGVKVVVTDYTDNNQADFVLSTNTFRRLAQPTKSSELLKIGVPDVEYKRIPCEYPYMKVKINKISSFPYYLAVIFLDQGGQTDISGVGVGKAGLGSADWQYMTHNYGAVWSINDPPLGAMSLRWVVTSGYDRVWMYSKRGVLPSNWKVGSVYDIGVQIKQIAAEDCSPCNTQDWDYQHNN